MKKKILLATITLAFMAGTLVTSAPLHNAMAANPTLVDIMTTLGNIQTQLTGIQTTDSAIKTKTDNLPTDPASQSLIGNTKSVVVDKLLNVPAPSGTSDGIAILELIPAIPGKTFSGHISLHFVGSSTEVVDVECEMETGAMSLGLIGFHDAINTDFACNQIRLFLVNHDTIPNSGTIEAVIQYVENSNISTIS